MRTVTEAIEYLEQVGYTVSGHLPYNLPACDFMITWPGTPRRFMNSARLLEFAGKVQAEEEGRADSYYVDLTGLA